MITMQLAKESVYANAGCAADQLKQAAAWCQKALSKVQNITVEKTRLCVKFKRRWNGDDKARRMILSQEKK